MGNSSYSTEKISLAGVNVLLVEDCPDQQRFYLAVLQKSGAQVSLECNGESAVDAVRKIPSQFDAIVMDFQMPEMDGLEATSKVRELGFGGAIVAITIQCSDALRESWYRAGCDVFLPKPVKAKTLIETLQLHLTNAGAAP